MTIGIVSVLLLRIDDTEELASSGPIVMVSSAKGAASVVVPEAEEFVTPRAIRCSKALSTPSADVVWLAVDFKKQLPVSDPVA